jgi:hypothetical protein
MRHIAFFLAVLLFWGLVDDYVVCGLELSPNASASDDDEYLHGQGRRIPERIAEHEKTPLWAAALPTDGRLTFAEASLVLAFCDLQAFGCDSRLYALMSLQI